MCYETPSEVVKLADVRITDQYKEHCLVFSFNTRGGFLGADIISIGTLNANIVHPREVFEAAIRRHASHIILVHNHPSGDTEPSENDLDITARMVDAGNILGIAVIDHLIVGGGSFFSFRERALI